MLLEDGRLRYTNVQQSDRKNLFRFVVYVADIMARHVSHVLFADFSLMSSEISTSCRDSWLFLVVYYKLGSL